MSERPVALITGTSRGIGRHLARHYFERGFLVVGCSRSGASPLDAPEYTHHVADVSDETAVRTMFADTQRKYGRLDVLINNAGVAFMNHALLTPGSAVLKVLGTNVAGPFFACREAAKIMSRRQYGRIVNMVTVAVPLNLAGEALYASSKAALLTLTRILAIELAPMGITVNAVGPTPTDTDLVRGVPKDALASLLARQAIPRMAAMDDIHNVVDFFVSPDSGFVTGQVIYLGGVA